jgi:hypothetical protein
MENNERVSIILLSLVLLTSFATAQAAGEPKTSKPAQGMPTMDCPMIKGGDSKMMMNCPIMKSGYGTTNGMPSMMSHHQMMMDMQKPATGRQQKEAPMPMDHEHQCLCRSA